MDERWTEALALMRRALTILDQSQAPPEVGADLDLAIARLEGRFGELGLDSPDLASLDVSFSQDSAMPHEQPAKARSL